ncbi:hypothetical protein SAICODRAFT_30928 [Saitoella complicata NRRL Y-17804]|nr:uncharacterized protein SAICODRAFT_30928 [Saitoella complicata NRRL Y-17804]ODQ52178.1 hypothetical protein SAICODRAFT_30928 [Saitoella complicata NRRL Y-17804]
MDDFLDLDTCTPVLILSYLILGLLFLLTMDTGLGLVSVRVYCSRDPVLHLDCV